ncbi:diguanylate cyclase [Sphingopyxis sp. BSN-002]|uniref:sensor domain-containing diguanylate cyclase n=1 Tax=Sphingopyxis sp. BSN-002 TaxID=2911495 RepID=UPI001EDC580B|nr:sensor domain-containing diguanylate cyclase [Sphingopyxis sp. BSN-002]UKK84575.1 diguanylate cyclase [Sphingopyxis sp. BSN-002]
MTTINTDAFRTLLETVPDGFFVHDESGRFLDVNAQSCADLGYSREELLGLSISDISRGADRAANAKRWADTPVGMATRFREIAVRKDGSSFPVEISLTCQAIDGRKLFFGLARDVSEGDVALREANDRLSMAARVGGLGIWDYDIANDVLDCDDQWYRIMGRDPAERVRRIAEFREFVHPDDAAEVTEVDLTVARLAAEERDYGMLFRIFRPDGSMRWVRSSARLVEDGEGKPARAVGFVVDVTESRLAEQSLEQRALEDPLTGLANRRRLDDELVKACLHATRTGEPLSLAMIDVDHFKLYNDGEGHVRGDAALKALAGILQSVTRRPYDLAARYGGEEFLLLLPGVDEPEPILQRIAEELGALRIPHPLSPVAPHLTVSCGCVIASELADVAPLDLLAACDRALYQAKQGGRDRVEIARL